MKLIDGLKLKGSPAEIPDALRDDLPSFFTEMGYKVGAEIGVDRGEFSEKFCKAGLTLYSIDPWRGRPSRYEETKRLLAPYLNCTIIRKTSMEAIDDFPHESLDFIYIDGSHDFRFVAEDISEWTKKVRKGGIVSGHDYFYTKSSNHTINWHVAYVLNAYIQAYNIKNWYLIGRKKSQQGEKRDRWRSWMFVKTW
jgi:hypothetical protein